MILLLGDFNAKHEQWDPSSTGNAAGHAMASLLTDFSLFQCVTTPTRYTSDGLGSSVLDLLATDRPDLLSYISVTDPISDHCCVLATFRLSCLPAKKTVMRRYVAPCSRPVPYSRHSPYSRHFVQHLLVLFQGFNDSL